MISSERASLKRLIKIYQKFIKRLSKSHQNESNIVLRKQNKRFAAILFFILFKFH